MRAMARSFVLLAFVLTLVMPSPVPAAPEGQLTWALHVTLAPVWFDPGEAPGIITPFLFYYALHDALAKPMPASQMAPSLAEAWSVSKDGLTYEFVLRKGVKFHNGDSFTAEDVRFTFERYRGSGAKELKARVREVEVVDPHRVRFHLKAPWPDFLAFYATPATGAAWIVPKAYVQRVGDDGFRKHPVGLGPYKFVSVTPGVEAVMDAYEGYWRKVPQIKRLVFKVAPEESARLAMVKRGEADIAYLITGPLAAEARRDPALRLDTSLLISVFWLQFADQFDPKSPWHDRRVRLAANHALDRKAISEAETLGFSPVTGGMVPRSFDYALPIPPYPYDPAKAKQLLAEAGYPNGFDAGDLYPFPPYVSMGEAVANYLRAVGIRARLVSMERAAFMAAWREKKLRNLYFGASAAYGNAATRIEAFVAAGGIYVAGSYPDVDGLFKEQAGELDPKKREAILHQIQRMIHERAMFAPIWELAFLNVAGSRVDFSGLGAIPGYAYSAPYEDLRLKKR